MLLTLHIKNYALIDDLRLEFREGLNIFTGETGAGKSIIIESLGLILGERASAQAVRNGAGRCFISGEFDCTGSKELIRFLEEQGLSADETLLLRREIDAAGKSRAFVNDLPVSIGTLHAIGEYLVDVHGQHEHQSLMRLATQRAMLDSFGDLDPLRGEVAEHFRRWRDLAAQEQSQQMSEQERQRLIDLYDFQLREIDEAKLIPGEEEEIEQALPQLKNAEKLQSLSDEAYGMLYNTEGAVIERLSKVQRTLDTIHSLGNALTETTENLKTVYYQIEEIARDIENFRDGLQAEPGRLNELMERQDDIHKLKKKYGATISAILAYREQIGNELDVLSRNDENRQELERKIATAKETLLVLCEKLSRQRKKAAERLGHGIEKELQDLGMKKARFEVAFEKEAEPTSDGIDRLEFIFSANPGESPKSLKGIASGGEMSRVMLAIKTVLAAADNVPVLVFDEIDAGIGGPMGQVVGKKLKKLSCHHQVLCITHLPQIAAFADEHLHVAKESKAGRTNTSVRTLPKEERIEEIARMLSGAAVTPAARKHAEELIESSQKSRL
jgi:DNA repair protein RecN (Recombination protein N)